jgi:NAD(P)-dependent dehydrogenase (short-subunit alcohol dehydrogenase family)
VPQLAVITGGSAGIGLAAAQAMAARGDHVVLVGRHPGRLARAVERVRDAGGRTPAAYRADFAVLDEVRQVGERIAGEFEHIDVLANNAGQLAAWSRRTVDGHNVTMQVNHLAGFLLSHLLLDRLRSAAAASGVPARLITTGSAAEAWAWLDVDEPASPKLRYRSRWLAYGSSKQANVLFTVEAARRWGPLGIRPTCFFPGLVRTRFAPSSPMFWIGKLMPVVVSSPARGADTLVWLSDPRTAAEAGGYYFWRTPFAATPRSIDPERAARLWQASRTAVGLTVEPGWLTR